MSGQLQIVAGTFIAYTLLFFLNDRLFGELGFSEAVHWIYLPSGLRLAFVLIFVELGAIGVALASMFAASFFYFGGDPLSVCASGLISGLAPYLARYVCHHKLGMDLELKNLTAGKLFAVALVFALMSASMHQVFYTWRGYTEHFLSSTAVMAFGDLMGTIIVLYTVKLVLSNSLFKTP